MKKPIVSLCLAVLMTLGLVTTALASGYATPPDTSGYLPYGQLSDTSGGVTDDGFIVTEDPVAMEALALFEKHFEGEFITGNVPLSAVKGETTLSVKTDLKGMSVETLKLFVYDPVTYTYRRITNVTFKYVNGVLTFTTPEGGILIITNAL